MTPTALCYAVNGLVARQLPRMPVEAVGTGTLPCATLTGLPFCLAVDRPWQIAPSARSVAALIGLGIVNTAGGYLLPFRLVVRAGAGFASLNVVGLTLAALCDVQCRAGLIGPAFGRDRNAHFMRRVGRKASPAPLCSRDGQPGSKVSAARGWVWGGRPPQRLI